MRYELLFVEVASEVRRYLTIDLQHDRLSAEYESRQTHRRAAVHDSRRCREGILKQRKLNRADEGHVGCNGSYVVALVLGTGRTPIELHCGVRLMIGPVKELRFLRQQPKRSEHGMSTARVDQLDVVDHRLSLAFFLNQRFSRVCGFRQNAPSSGSRRPMSRPSRTLRGGSYACKREGAVPPQH